jgi:DNA-binding NarL/FixJ family response regulator
MSTQTDRIRVLVVADHEAIRRGLSHLMSVYADLIVIGEGADSATALSQTQSLEPDVVLLDQRLSDGSGFAAAAQIRRAMPSARIILMVDTDWVNTKEQACAPIAHACLLKRCADEYLVEMIRAVVQGEQWAK